MKLGCRFRGHDWDVQHRSTTFSAPEGYVRCARCGEWQTHYINEHDRLIGGPFDGMQYDDLGRPNLVIAYNDDTGRIVQAHYSYGRYRKPTSPSEPNKPYEPPKHYEPEACEENPSLQLEYGRDLQLGDIIALTGSDYIWIIESIEHEGNRLNIMLYQKGDRHIKARTSQLDSFPFRRLGRWMLPLMLRRPLLIMPQKTSAGALCCPRGNLPHKRHYVKFVRAAKFLNCETREPPSAFVSPSPCAAKFWSDRPLYIRHSSSTCTSVACMD